MWSQPYWPRRRAGHIHGQRRLGVLDLHHRDNILSYLPSVTSQFVYCWFTVGRSGRKPIWRSSPEESERPMKSRKSAPLSRGWKRTTLSWTVQEPVTVGLSEGAKEKLRRLAEDNYFRQQVDAYPFAIGLALAQGVDPPEVHQERTIFNIGSFDPDGAIKRSIQAIMGDRPQWYCRLQDGRAPRRMGHQRTDLTGRSRTN